MSKGLYSESAGVKVIDSVDDTIISDLLATNLIGFWVNRSPYPTDMTVS